MKMLKVSVIVPIYNVEKYLAKCIETLLGQTLQEIEIILVNDGSEDKSGEIAKYYQKKYPQKIIYLEKENGGLSDSRNYGVKHASGEYLSFIDADDFVEKDLYKNLESYMSQEIDLIKFKMQTINEKQEVLEKIGGPTFEVCSGEEAFEKLCVTDKFLEVACIYLYRTQFFKQNNFQYEVGTYHEDFGLTPYIMIKAKKVVSTNIYGYYYLQRENSITSNQNIEKEKKKAWDVLEHYDKAMQRIKQEQVEEKTKMLFKRYYTNSVLIKAKELKKYELRKYLEELRKRKIYKNIKATNIKQFLKKILLKVNIKLYLKMR